MLCPRNGAVNLEGPGANHAVSGMPRRVAFVPSIRPTGAQLGWCRGFSGWGGLAGEAGMGRGEGGPSGRVAQGEGRAEIGQLGWIQNPVPGPYPVALIQTIAGHSDLHLLNSTAHMQATL